MKTKESIQNNEITVSHFLRKSKRKYYSSLDVKIVTNNRTFWKAAKPFPSDKLNLVPAIFYQIFIFFTN